MTVIDKAVEALVAMFMAALVVLVFLAVLFRYVLNDPLTWSEEVGRICLVWVSFLGAYLAHRRADHIAVTALLQGLPDRVRMMVRLAVTALLFGFLAVLVWYGGQYALRFIAATTPLLDIPVGAVYLAMPLSALLIALSMIVGVAGEVNDWLRSKRSGTGSE